MDLMVPTPFRIGSVVESTISSIAHGTVKWGQPQSWCLECVGQVGVEDTGILGRVVPHWKPTGVWLPVLHAFPLSGSTCIVIRLDPYLRTNRSNIRE